MMVLSSDAQLDALSGEAVMLPGLIDWLRRQRWIRDDSIAYLEFPVNGRRVDLVTRTKTGRLSAYELKIGNFGRVLEQAVYNTKLFDRSWVVVDSIPRPANVKEASRFGVGVIVFQENRIHIVVKATARATDPGTQAKVRLLANERSR